MKRFLTILAMMPMLMGSIAPGSLWKFDDTGTDMGTMWRDFGFEDVCWRVGAAELGYGDGDEATVISFGPDSGDKHRTYYFRHIFAVTDPATVASATLRFLHDDGSVVYLNSTEIARLNMPSGTITYDTFASSTLGGSEETTWHEFIVDPVLLVAGNNIMAVEVHQGNASSSDVSFDLELEIAIDTPPTASLGNFGWDEVTEDCEQEVEMFVSYDVMTADATPFFMPWGIVIENVNDTFFSFDDIPVPCLGCATFIRVRTRDCCNTSDECL